MIVLLPERRRRRFFLAAFAPLARHALKHAAPEPVHSHNVVARMWQANGARFAMRATSRREVATRIAAALYKRRV
jgi:hypothetical protein